MLNIYNDLEKINNMNEKCKTTGQIINYKEHNDNAPPNFSAPSTLFKNVLNFHANKNCSRCGGNGYIGDFKNIAGGRCFQCLPDERWNDLLGELRLTGTDNISGEEICEIRLVSDKIYRFNGYIVTKVGLPPTGSAQIFSTIEEACKFASEIYGV